MTRGKQTIGIIGAGLGGLAAACTLAARGYDVVLFEKNAWLGGKAAVLHVEGYRFDMGPTILLMPSVLKRIFAEAGRDLTAELELVALDPQWRSFFADGSTLDLHSSTELMVAARPVCLVRVGLPRVPAVSRTIAAARRHLAPVFFWRSIGGLKDMFDPATAVSPATLSDVLAMRPWSTVGSTIRSFVGDRRVAQMLDHFTQYVGSSPDRSPAVLCGIANMQTREGIWYPRGGTRAVAESLERLARGLGVELRTGIGIASIELDASGAVAGVVTERQSRALAAIVSNADAVRTHRELLKGERAAAKFERRRSYEPACSGVVLYLGLDRRYDHLRHHDFVFSADPHEEFDWIYRRGEPPPTRHVTSWLPAATDPSAAPPGGEALYVLVHTPYLRPHHDWKAIFPGYRQTILDKLKKTAGLDDIEDRIQVERRLTPQDIHDRYHVLNGAIYGLASHGRFWAHSSPPTAIDVSRSIPGRRAPPIRGLACRWSSCPAGSRRMRSTVMMPAGHPPPPSTPWSRRAHVYDPDDLTAAVWLGLAGSTRGYLRRSFHAVHIALIGIPPAIEGRSAVVDLNDARVVDPLVGKCCCDNILAGAKAFRTNRCRGDGQVPVLRAARIFPRGTIHAGGAAIPGIERRHPE